MFIKPSAAARLFKEAYKGIGLRIANTGDGLVLTGRAWHIFIYRENIPKEIMGEIIKLTGDIPKKGEQLLYSKDSGAQIELYLVEPHQDVYRRATEAQAEGNDVWATRIMIADAWEKPFRVYKTDKFCYAIPEGIRAMISAEWCDQNEEMYGAFATQLGWLYWVSSYMAFGYPAFVTDDEVKGQALKLQEAGIL